MNNSTDKKAAMFRFEGHNYLMPFLLISSLFFMWGFAHGILEVLNPVFLESFFISKSMSSIKLSDVYVSYIVMSFR